MAIWENAWSDVVERSKETSGFQLGKLAFVQMMANMQGGKTLNELTVDAKFVEGGSM
jgi:hypothetical protein